MKYVKNTDFCNSPRISLVGAGPGDPELISRKGYRLLQEADVVLYDALVSKVLLDELPQKVQKVYVGKRCGQHSWTQDEINQFLVDCAFRYGHVVRLKGGDPFVFGRGHEELQFAEGYGIPVEVIPGISSAIAGPASVGIPVTHRGVSNSFWVITATTRHHQISEDIKLAAQTSSTLVILMGTRKLSEIVQLVLQYRSAETPVGLIESATLPNARTIMGRLGGVEALAAEQAFSAPGIIVIGEVAGLHPFFQSTNRTESTSDSAAKEWRNSSATIVG
ncbi:MAG: uroporphyrinogen-III C-methyltransferase [Saprospiraceae bacterium]|nr:uroporphyrinogen-III C-methyltransferase [Saprospiraceae bacterium]